MLLKADNRSLIKDREKTYLTADADAAATTLTLRAVDNLNWADNDYLIIGEIGTRTAEIMQANGTVSDGTSLIIDRSGAAGGTRFAHSVGDPVYRIDYNRIEYSRNTTDTSSGSSILVTQEIQPHKLYSWYEDATNTTGFGFIRWNNQTSATFSPYSDGAPYAGYGTRTLYRMREKIRRLINEPIEASQRFISDDDIRQEINNIQRQVSQERLWPFYERTRSFAGVANQWRYTVNDDVSKIHYAIYDQKPIAVIQRNRYDMLFYDSAPTGTPTHCAVWRDEEDAARVYLFVYPRTANAADTDQLNGAINATVTTVTVDSTSGFPSKGRFIVESEVIEYDGTTSTTFTGCRRGAEGTTAATHADNTAITERDFFYHYHLDPVDLVDPNDVTRIPDSDVLVYGASANLALQKSEQPLHDRLYKKYQDSLEKLRKNFSDMQTGGSMRVRVIEELSSDAGVRDPNKSPRDATGFA